MNNKRRDEAAHAWVKEFVIDANECPFVAASSGFKAGYDSGFVDAIKKLHGITSRLVEDLRAIDPHDANIYEKVKIALEEFENAD